MCVCVWVGVVIPFIILDVRLVDAPAGVTQEEGHTEFVHLPSAGLALIFVAGRIQSRPFTSSTVKSTFCVPRISPCILVGHDFSYIYIYILLFCEEKSLFVRLHRDSNSRPNIKRFRCYRLDHRGERQRKEPALDLASSTLPNRHIRPGHVYTKTVLLYVSAPFVLLATKSVYLHLIIKTLYFCLKVVVVVAIMNRRSTNEKAIFKATTAAHNKDLQAALNNRRMEMDSEWDALDKKWEELESRMKVIGVTKPVILDAYVAHLNVGGLPMNIRSSQLQSTTHKNATEWALATLYDGGWDSRVPRDKDGKIFLDESPTIFQHLFNKQLMALAMPQASAITRDVTCPTSIAADQLSYLSHVSNDLGFKVMQVVGGSTTLTENELQRFSVQVRSWCQGSPQRLELIYRGSRDGLTAHAFHGKCTDESPATITLVKVDHGGRDSGSSVIGGFSSVAWVPTGDQEVCFGANKKESPHSFVFMVKSSSAKEGQQYQPIQWTLPQGSTSYPVIRCGEKLGPHFCGGFGVCCSRLKLQVNSKMARITGYKASELRKLHQKNVSEIEVYRVCNEIAAPAVRNVSDVTETMAAEHADNDRLFCGACR